MKHHMYSIHDAKAEAYNMPFYQRTHGEALRSFESACADEKSNMNRYAEDYTLFHVGTYDDQSASIEPLLTPLPLAKANEVIARQASAA